MARFLTLLACLLSLVVDAQSVADWHARACNALGQPFHVTVESEFELLWMRPSRCGLEYGVADPTSYTFPTTEQVGPSGKLHAVAPDYSFGFRVGLRNLCVNGRSDMRILYTRLHTSDRRHLAPSPDSGGLWAVDLNSSDVVDGGPPFVQTILFNPSGDPSLPFEVGAEISPRTTFHYDAVEFHVAARWRPECRLHFRTFAGVHYARIHTDHNIASVGTLHPGVVGGDFESRTVNGRVTSRGRAWGIGPGIGVSGNYDLWCGFGVGGTTGMALLTGTRNSHYTQTYLTRQSAPANAILADRTYDLFSQCESFVVPEFNFRMGLDYTFRCRRDFLLVAEVGYEMITYLQMVPTGINFSQDRSVISQECTTVGFDGLYLSLLAQF